MKVKVKFPSTTIITFEAADAWSAYDGLIKLLNKELHEEFYRPVTVFAVPDGAGALPFRMQEAEVAEAAGEWYEYTTPFRVLTQERGRVSGLSSVLGTITVYL